MEKLPPMNSSMMASSDEEKMKGCPASSGSGSSPGCNTWPATNSIGPAPRDPEAVAHPGMMSSSKKQDAGPTRLA